MDRERLTPFGEPILQTEECAGLRRTRFVLVAFDGKPIGVGLYHDNNKFCSAAILTDKEISEAFISHVDENHVIEPGEIVDLRKIYNWAFK